MLESPTIRTNHQYRNLTYGYELTEKQRADFDYIDEEEIMSHDFLKYRGIVYDVGSFERSNVAGWDGQFCDSFFSAILIKFDPKDSDRVICALYLA